MDEVTGSSSSSAGLLAGASSKALPTGSSGGPPAQTPAQMALMVPLRLASGAAPTALTEAWVDGKAKAVRLSLSPPDEATLVVGYDTSGKTRTPDDFSVSRCAPALCRGQRRAGHSTGIVVLRCLLLRT